MRFLFVALAALAVISCGSAAAGVADYDHARYPQALDALADAEHDALSWSGRRRARYALYRGLTHLALGDREQTLRWLGEAKSAADRDPALFCTEDAGRLSAAWAHLQLR